MFAIDKPTKIDGFGFDPYVQGIEGVIRNLKADDLPFAVGIYGAWGSGKTSFMLQLQNRLERESDNTTPLPTVWFDAWKYDRIQDLRSALIYKILFEIRRRSSGNTKAIIGRAASKFLKIGNIGVQNTKVNLNLGIATINPPSIDELKTSTEVIERFQTEVDKFSELFSKAVQKWLEVKYPGENKKLIVFVDDLDRCLPDNVIIVLEALKLFLDKSPCVFVIGIDRVVVEKAIQMHYGVNPGVSGREYLDKIIQLPFMVPPADSEKFIDVFERKIDLNLSEQDRTIFSTAAAGNPRVYHRMLSSWKVSSELAPHCKLNVDTNLGQRFLLLLATAIAVRFPKLHEVCQKSPKNFSILWDSIKTEGVYKNPNFINSGQALEYKTFAEDIDIRLFLHELIRKYTGKDFIDLLSHEDSVRKAFTLSASTIKL